MVRQMALVAPGFAVALLALAIAVAPARAESEMHQSPLLEQYASPEAESAGRDVGPPETVPARRSAPGNGRSRSRRHRDR